jgi:polyferredoxin
MFDKDTLIITYDKERGEPRAPISKSKQQTGNGSCIDCSLCVQVCPTGIDIRNGLQYECIGCASCVDACNSVMDKIGQPRGLVRYTTEHGLVKQVHSGPDP